MSCIRKNTLVVDFGVLPTRPELCKIECFMEKELKLNLADVKCIQLHNTRNCVFIEMIDNETALRYEKAHNIQRSIVCNGKPFKIPVYVDSEAVTVRVCDLPPSIPHVVVAEYMRRFGDVISIQGERWKNYFPGVFNGVRVLQIRLKQPIPSFITISNEIATVFHPNQVKTCRWCCKPVHPQQKCLEVTSSNIRPAAAAVINQSSSTEQKFDEADFPPISPSVEARDKRTFAECEPQPNNVATNLVQQQRTNTDGDDDDDVGNDHDDSSSSPYESCDGTNKRRLSTKRGKEKKKVCGAILGSQSDCDSNSSVILL
ncbi:hypothetical protein RP20_CCG020357 [Aedes albopictus]|nr:hypothetical protein RP20_CCG020357 [Aedes albopictus]